MVSWSDIGAFCLAALSISGSILALLHLYAIWNPDGFLANRTGPKVIVNVNILDELTGQPAMLRGQLQAVQNQLDEITRNQLRHEGLVVGVAQVRRRRPPQR
jgi:hypothetical protein